MMTGMGRHHYAVFSARYRPLIGGVESFSANLAEALVGNGNAVDIVAMHTDRSSAPHEQEMDGLEVFRLPCIPLMNGRLPWTRRNPEYKRMFNALLERDVERVLINTRFYPHSLEGLRYASLKNVPALVLDHGSAHLTLGSAPADLLIRRFEHAITHRVQRYQPHFAGISQASTRWLRHFGIETDCVIPNAIDAYGFRDLASARDFREELNCKDAFLVSFVGRLTQEKGARELVEAARLLDEGYMFALAGEGNLHQELERSLPQNVALLGNLGKDDISALLRASDTFCLPSRSEGFCTALLEASAWGVPSVIPHIGGTDELIPDAGHGIVLDDTRPPTIASALAELKEDVQRQRINGNNVRKLVCSRYGWDNSVAALEAAYESMETTIRTSRTGR